MINKNQERIIAMPYLGDFIGQLIAELTISRYPQLTFPDIRNPKIRIYLYMEIRVQKNKRHWYQSTISGRS